MGLHYKLKTSKDFSTTSGPSLAPLIFHLGKTKPKELNYHLLITKSLHTLKRRLTKRMSNLSPNCK